MVIKQVQGSYKDNHSRLRSYNNLVLDLLEYFKQYHFIVIRRKENVVVDALIAPATIFHVPKHPNKQYKIEVKHRPTIPDNVDHWKVFEDDEHINKFMEMSGEFEGLNLNKETMFEEGESAEPDLEYLTQLVGKDIIQLKSNTIPRGLVPLE